MTRSFTLMLLALFAISFSAPLAPAADKPASPAAKAKDKPKDAKPDAGGGSATDALLKELRDRFKQRYAQIAALKKQGVIGETYEGYVDFVKDKPSDAKELVDQENADRKELYKLLAEKEGTTPEKVAERNAKRNFEKASAGEFLKDADGKWTKKS
jgi:uncharacterized protein YdbL (DUF1318 family)